MSAIREVSISKDAGPLKSSLFANGQKHIIIANCKFCQWDIGSPQTRLIFEGFGLAAVNINYTVIC
jgi:hypothetical protein